MVIMIKKKIVLIYGYFSVDLTETYQIKIMPVILWYECHYCFSLLSLEVKNIRR